MGTMTNAWMRAVAGIAALTAFALSAGSASAYTVQGPWIAQGYVTGFPTPPADSAGPLGLAFDSSANLLVTDINSGTLHRVKPGGGTTPGSVMASGLSNAAGLAFGADGPLYMARADHGPINELNPANGGVIRTVIS